MICLIFHRRTECAFAEKFERRFNTKLFRKKVDPRQLQELIQRQQQFSKIRESVLGF